MNLISKVINNWNPICAHTLAFTIAFFLSVSTCHLSCLPTFVSVFLNPTKNFSKVECIWSVFFFCFLTMLILILILNVLLIFYFWQFLGIMFCFLWSFCGILSMFGVLCSVFNEIFVLMCFLQKNLSDTNVTGVKDWVWKLKCIALKSDTNRKVRESSSVQQLNWKWNLLHKHTTWLVRFLQQNSSPYYLI